MLGSLPGASASNSCCGIGVRFFRRDQNSHSITPPIAMTPSATPTPIPAAAPLLSPWLVLSAAADVVEDAVSDATEPVDVCEPDVVVVASVDVAGPFCITTPYAIIVPGARRLIAVPAVSSPAIVPSIVVKLVCVSTLYTLIHPSVGPQG